MTQMTSRRPNERLKLTLLALGSFFVGLDSIITVPLLPEMAASTAIPEHAGALLVTSYALVYMIAAPVCGALSDRYGRKKMMVLGMLLLAAGTLLTGFGRRFADLMVFRGLTGLGAGMLEPAILAYVGDQFPYEQRGRAMGIVMGALVGSTLFGVPVGTAVAQIGSWQWTFHGIALLTVVVLMLIRRHIPDDAPDAHGRTEERKEPPLRGMLRPFAAVSRRSVISALLATFLWFGGLQGMFANIGMYYNRNFGLDVSTIGLILMAAGLGSVAGTVLGGKLSDLWSKKTVIGIASVATAAGVLGVSLAGGNVGLAVSVHVLWSAFYGFGQSALNALVSELDAANRGTVMALNSTAMYGGMMAATAASALLLQGGSFLPVGILCATAAGMVFPITRWMVREEPAAGTAGTRSAE